MRTDLSSPVAIVVGGASGMGAAVADRLANSGQLTAIGDIDLERANTVASRMRGNALAVHLDVTAPASISAAVTRITDHWNSPPTVLVYAAGVLRTTRFPDITLDEWRQSMAVNLDGAFLATQAVLPGMRAAGWGRIVIFSSTAGKSVSTLGGAHYTASKTGLLGLVRALAVEVASEGITVNGVCPGLIDTPMIGSVASREQLAAFAESFPIQRLGTPAEVAALVAFLCSDEAGYITGASIDINGGDLTV